jgi:sec-independent protein translocase protein TatA
MDMNGVPLAFIQNLGWTEILLIVLVILLLFGAKKIPEVARSLGRGVKEFKKGIKETTIDLEDEDERRDGEKKDGTPPAAGGSSGAPPAG